MNQVPTSSDPGTTLMILGAVALSYLIPTAIALWRGTANTFLIFLVNFLLGWTGVIWIVCMIWACVGQTKMQKRFYANAVKEQANAH